MVFKSWLILACGVGVCIAVSVRLSYRWSGNLIITFLDVGQGDSAIVRLPSNKVVVIDAPRGFGKRSWGEEVVAELALKGHLAIDRIVMTHTDNDHSGGLPHIVSSLSTRLLVIPEAFLKAKVVEDLRARLAKNGGRLEAISGLERWSYGGVDWEVFAPGAWCGEECGDNDRSLIAQIGFAGCRVLFTGDIGKGSEREWLALKKGQIDLLKVPHHGSKTSSTEEFLSALRPTLAVVSVGWKNPYRHPHPTVVRRYSRHRIRLLRTDTDGFVRVTITPAGKMLCESAHGPCGRYQCSGISRSIFFKDVKRSRSSAALSN